MRLTLLFLLLCAATFAQAQIRPLSTAAKGVYTVPNTSFQPDLSLGYANGNAGDGIAFADGGSGVRLVASVQLPQGAIIDSVKSFYIDNADPNDMSITLASYENAKNSGMKAVFSSNTSGKSSDVRSIKAPIASTTIDNDKNSYYLLVQPSNGSWPAKPQRMGIRSVVFYYH
ncbi:MAG TPA: hypothetical protein VHM26_00140 [Chitinophagaceae bacterium]|jgi:hypothetical protein|nr:hypothetical protein [Chitinophagaceae bacterium]